MKTKLRLVLSIPIFFFCFSLLSQDGPNFWQKKPDLAQRYTASGEALKTGAGQAYVLEETALRQALEPLHDRPGSERLIRFPDAFGKFRAYRVQERSVMANELQQRYPGIRSYIGIGTGKHPDRIRFSVSHKGFQAMVSDPGGQKTRFIEKVPGAGQTYISFSRDQKMADASAWKCKMQSSMGTEVPADPLFELVDDQLLRRFRLAVATTGEYADYHGGTVTDALAAINATLTRINEVFERDLAITLELIAANDQVIYTDAATDPFGGNLNAEVQTTLNSVIGPGGYDIGHLFHRASENGNAGAIGTVCVDNLKGGAFAATPTPEGDRFDLDFVAHEMGHQFGANHTWSFDSEGTGVQAEPASGTTIMGYAGIAQGNNVAVTGEDYFHYYSILQILDYATGLSCGSQIPLANSPPFVLQKPDFVIPQGTAFVLEGAANDPDPGDVLTYTWEQIDDGIVTTASFGPENPSGANFRSLRPTTESARYFPRLDRILGGTLTQSNPATGAAWETVATIERDLNFALTVRDNAPGGGQVVSDLVRVSVRAGSGPFAVTSQATAQTYQAGSLQTINWDVAGTSNAPINSQEVDILFSGDGGATFSESLGASLPNTGTARVQMPSSATSTGRIMVRASDNIFLAVNAAEIAIEEVPFVLEAESLDIFACQPDDGILDFTYRNFGGFSEEVTLSVAGLPPGLTASFSSPTVQTDNTPLQLTLSGTGLASTGTFPITLTGTSASEQFDLPVELHIAPGAAAVPNLVSPADLEPAVSLNPTLAWEAVSQAEAYRLELATDPGFSALVAQEEVYGTSYTLSALSENTTYYWRVKTLNPCGESAFSTAFSFQTIQPSCRTVSATSTPIAISATGTPTVSTSVSFLEDFPVVSARVGLDIEHTYLSDLIVTLTSPQGTAVTLISNSCAEANDLVADFQADAPPFVCANNPAISGTVRPLGSLNSFAGESSFGTWTLTIEDTAPSDGGRLNAFSLELCVEGTFRPDADGDGVFDDGDDLCLGTPPGTEVDVTGCPVFRFDAQQFDIEVATEQCVGSGDGSIGILASEALQYTATLTGTGPDQSGSFSTSFEFMDLSPGNYQLCLEGTDGTIVYEPFCYELVIGSPDPLSVLVNPSPDGSRLDLLLDGSELYRILLNGREQIVSGPGLTLDLKAGTNTLKVEGIPACKGSFEAAYFYADQPVVAPNPFEERLEFYLPWSGQQTDMEVFNAAGVLVYSTRLVPLDNRAEARLPVLPSGMYLIRLRTDGAALTYKLFKR